jgi:MYXO-CTERM domain-containing protein
VLATGSANLYATTQVAEPSNGSTASSFAFVVNAPSAGSYTVAVNDFQFPVQLQSLSFTVAQGGAPLTTGANGSFTASAGPIVVLVDAPASTGGSGVFSVTVAQTGSATLLLDQTQAVGGVFSSNTVNIGAAGSYDVTLADLGFPATFQNLAAVVSSAGQVVGKIYGSGMFPVSATPGQYLITFVATPGAQNYGLYSIDIAAAGPTVTLSASATSVAAGQPVQLTWSSENATTCTASGNSAWSGTEPTSGSAGVTIQASVTLTLMCTGPGGSSSQSVSVAAIPSTTSSSGGGGGGALDQAALWMLTALAGLVASRRRANQKADRPVNSRPTANW